MSINSAQKGTFVPLPVSAALYLKEAGEKELKALIFLLTLPNDNYSIKKSDLETLGMTQKDFWKSVFFWEEHKVLPIPPIVKQKIKAFSQQYLLPDNPSASLGNVLENDDLAELAKRAERILGTTLSSAQISSLYEMHTNIGLSVSVIEVLLTYCASIGKTNVPYIQKVAFEWSKEGITTPAEAETHIKMISSVLSFEGRLCRILGIYDRKLTPTEKKYAAEWSKWDLSDELITLAYDRTVKNTGKLALPYMNKILFSWHEAGYKTIDEVEKGSAVHKKGRSGGGIDYDAYRKRSMDAIRNLGKKEG